MVKYCSAYGCREAFVKGGSVTFHKFPKDEKMRKVWESKLRRKDFKVTDFHTICSKHFKAECFDKSKFGGTWLKKDAVPTIFDFHDIPRSRKIKMEEDMEIHCGTLLREYAENEKIKIEDSIEICDGLPAEEGIENEKATQTEENMNIHNGSSAEGNFENERMRRLFFFGDFKEEDMSCPKKAQKFFEIAVDVSKKKNIEIQQLKRKNRRFQKRIARLEQKLRDMTIKSLLTNTSSNDIELTIPEVTASYSCSSDSDSEKD